MQNDPTAMRKSALKADITRAGELLSMAVAEAVSLDVAVPGTIHHCIAEVDRWAASVR